ncbi:hypothetical protein OROGR_029809 [Orobanche gracilis]
MGKRTKSSRKGKKAWRTSTSNEDFEDYFEKSTKDAISGGSLAHVPSDSLFFVDKSRDLSVKRKIEKSREKVMRCDSVLQRNPFIKAIPSLQNNKWSKKRSKVIPTAEDAAAPDSLKVFSPARQSDVVAERELPISLDAHTSAPMTRDFLKRLRLRNVETSWSKLQFDKPKGTFGPHCVCQVWKLALVIDDRLKEWDEQDQQRVHVVPAFTSYFAPQAEANYAIPVLCVAINVACNVRGGFFKVYLKLQSLATEKRGSGAKNASAFLKSLTSTLHYTISETEKASYVAHIQ